jgi:di/tricarboxylate transporter
MSVLIPHIIIIFLAMMFSMRAMFEAFIKGKNLVKYSMWTVILLTVGGMIFGPIVQKYAFDAYWTGWPFGGDLTDNKTLVSFVLWVVAYFMVRKNPKRRGWVIAAAIVLLLIYLIPHSMFGSEIDYTQQ